jgi:hypothetical protein
MELKTGVMALKIIEDHGLEDIVRETSLRTLHPFRERVRDF